MSYADNHEENLRTARIVLPWVKECNEKKIRVGARSVGRKFGFSPYYAEFLVTHYLTEMSIDAYPGEVLQVTQARGWEITSKFSHESRKVSIGKRKAANSQRKRDALIQSIVGNDEEKENAQETLLECGIQDIKIKREERQLVV
jgi:hypothetical protein